MSGKIRFVDIGDSWNAGFDDETRTDKGGWIAKLDPARFGRVASLSVSGSTAKQWAEDFDGRLSRAVELAPATDVYFVSLMGNDAYAAMAEGSEGGKTVTAAEIRAAVGNLRNVVSALAATGKRVLVMMYANPFQNNFVTACGCTALNAAIVFASANFVDSGDYIDSASVLEAPGMMSGIGIHPSDAGYAALARLAEGMFA